MQRFVRRLQAKLDLPSELISKEPKVAFYPGQNRVVIDNPCRILSYEGDKVVIDIHRGRLNIRGQNLRLNILLPDSLEIFGQFLQFEVEKSG